MASLNTRDAERDYEGNGPSSFDPVSRRIAPADVAPLSPEKMAAVEAAVAQCERAFGSANPHHAKWAAFYAERGRKAVAA